MLGGVAGRGGVLCNGDADMAPQGDNQVAGIDQGRDFDLCFDALFCGMAVSFCTVGGE